MCFYVLETLAWASWQNMSWNQMKNLCHYVVSRGTVRSAASSYTAMRKVAGSRPVLVIAWEWHIGLALLCGCSGALEYPTTNSCGPINKSLSLSLSLLFSVYLCFSLCAFVCCRVQPYNRAKARVRTSGEVTWRIGVAAVYRAWGWIQTFWACHLVVQSHRRRRWG